MLRILNAFMLARNVLSRVAGRSREVDNVGMRPLKDRVGFSVYVLGKKNRVDLSGLCTGESSWSVMEMLAW